MNLQRMADFYNKYNRDDDFHIHIYHHYDADGYAGAAVLAKPFLRINKKEELEYSCDIQFHVCEHSHPMDIGKINILEKNLVFIVDYSFSRIDDQEELLKLMELENVCIIWMDHHNTSEKIIADEPRFKDIIGLNVYGKQYAGVFLAYVYFDCIDWDDIHNIKITCETNEDESLCKLKWNECPDNWIKYVSDYDTWTHSIQDSKFFTKGVYFQGLYDAFLNLNSTDVSFLAFAVLNEGKDRDCFILEKDYIDLGKQITAIDAKRDARKVRNDSFEATLHLNFSRDYIDPKKAIAVDDRFIDGDKITGVIKILFLNSSGNSITFGDKINDYDAVSVFTFNGENFVYSLFSREDGFQCNLLALYFNAFYGITGGGHDHAAGWTSPHVDFKKEQAYILEDGMIR